MTTIRVCEHCGNRLSGKRAHARYCDSSCRADATRLRQELLGRSSGDDKALGSAQDAGVGSRGGNVRGLDEARDLQAQQKAKRDWAGAIDEQIRRTLLATGFFHADDLDPLGVPPEHCNLKGTRTAWFRNQGLMEKSGAERKISHKAANGRKAAIHRITKKGREELVGLDAGSSSGDRVASVESGESGEPPVPASRADHGGHLSPPAQPPSGSQVGAASPEPLKLVGDEVGRERPRSAITDPDLGAAA